MYKNYEYRGIDQSQTAVKVDYKKCFEKASSLLTASWDTNDFVAVNPFFNVRHKKFIDAISESQASSWSELLPSMDFFKKLYNENLLTRDDISHQLLKLRNHSSKKLSQLQINEVLSALETEDKELVLKYYSISDLYDLENDSQFSKRINIELSKWLSAFFDDVQSSWSMPNKELGLYAAWKSLVIYDNSFKDLSINLKQLVKSLPEDSHHAFEVLCEQVVTEFSLSDRELTNYLKRLLLSVSGWSSYIKKFEFEFERSGKKGASHTDLIDLLVMRMSYDLSLSTKIENKSGLLKNENASQNENKRFFIKYALLLSCEQSYRNEILSSLTKNLHSDKTVRPKAQMVFCIDVRSEVIRRQIENVMPEVETKGFAGFFGVPAKIKGYGHDLSDQNCPILIEPAVEVNEKLESEDALSALAMRKKNSKNIETLNKGQSAGNSCFTFVESLGLQYLFKLFKNNSGLVSPNIDFKNLGLTKVQSSSISPDTEALSFDLKCKIGMNALKNMNLIENFSKYVIFFGHESQSANNPYASGLDCGACSGHSGLGNSKILASILNDSEVRKFLNQQGMIIPADTIFISGVHNTTLDSLNIDSSKIDMKINYELNEIIKNLTIVQRKTRKEKSKALDLDHADDAFDQLVSLKATDWSEIRPEWGLARNASFIIADRSLTKNVDLKGRSFLHDYDASKDSDLSILELIMTAPLVVTNWINMQYYASTVANDKFGSGDKLLHNVVGGIGCIQGNGSDYLTGLSQQSLIKKGEYYHEPLRLQVFIQATPENISKIISKHQMLADLVGNDWLSIVSINPINNEALLFDGKDWNSMEKSLWN